jgi:hypothetical protein
VTRPIPLCGLAACTALAAAIAASAGPRDPLYQWTDERGAVRYTSEIERIPAGQRSAAVLIAAGRGGVRPAEPAEAPPTPNEPAAQPPAPGAAPVESAPPPAATAAPTDPKLLALDARIAELEQKIAAHEAALGDYISDPTRVGESRRGSGEVAAIADRLPKLQNELRELRVQRDAAARAAAPNAAP